MQTKKFSERFSLDLDLEDEKNRFVVRAFALIMTEPRLGVTMRSDLARLNEATEVLGIIFESKKQLYDHISEDINNCLRLLEGLNPRRHFGEKIQELLEASELDLGISWANGVFLPSGAKLLDERLVNDPLHWLSDPAHRIVKAPYVKALKHFMEADKRPELLLDVVTDAYEALEAMAKIVCDNDKDLTANRQTFIPKLNVSDRYKQMLKSYVEYARDFRHAPPKATRKPTPSKSEVESYIYVTGIFLRLGAETIGAIT